MPTFNSFRTGLLACTALLAFNCGFAFAQMALKSPQQVTKSLGTFSRVVLHTQILINAKNYVRLPHENGEVKEGTEALENAIASEPAAFRAKVEPLIKAADADSQSIADAAVAHDDAKLATAHAAYANSVKLLLAAFPASVQPPPPAPPKN
jgi:hypothetical protein